ncbi:MAG: NADH dehydrogenase [Myxococcota bacterium]|jgi:NADH dehydrogenase
MSERPRVLIIGGGFAGISSAQALKRAPVDVLVVDRRNHHLFQPLLYQVATAALAPADIAEPIRTVLRKQANAKVILGSVQSVDPVHKRIRVDDRWIEFDWLIIAAGVRHSYFGHPEWEQYAPGLKTIGDALEIRRRILTAFERAEWCDDDEARRKLMTFVVVGAGPTGVEVAGAIADIARLTLARDFRNIDTTSAHIILVEGGDKVLGVYPAPLPHRAHEQLTSLGVEVRLNTSVTGVDEDGVQLGDGERLDAATVVWAAGVQGSAVGEDAGFERHRSGRIPVKPDLSVPQYDHIFVAGDQAIIMGAGDKPVPGVAPAAMQMGKHAAKMIVASLKGHDRTPFRYTDRGQMATIGHARAIAATGPLKLSGFIAWLAWAFIHILFLITFRNRLVVLLKWAWAWVLFDRSSRLLWETEPSAAATQRDQADND